MKTLIGTIGLFLVFVTGLAFFSPNSPSPVDSSVFVHSSFRGAATAPLGFFTLEIFEPGVEKFSCALENFLKQWNSSQPLTIFTLFAPSDRFSPSSRHFLSEEGFSHHPGNISFHFHFPPRPGSILIQSIHRKQFHRFFSTTPLDWWLSNHVKWKIHTALRGFLWENHSPRRENFLYNPLEWEIPFYGHLKMMTILGILNQYGGIYVDSHLIPHRPLENFRSPNFFTTSAENPADQQNSNLPATNLRARTEQWNFTQFCSLAGVPIDENSAREADWSLLGLSSDHSIFRSLFSQLSQLYEKFNFSIAEAQNPIQSRLSENSLFALDPLRVAACLLSRWRDDSIIQIPAEQILDSRRLSKEFFTEHGPVENPLPYTFFIRFSPSRVGFSAPSLSPHSALASFYPLSCHFQPSPFHSSTQRRAVSALSYSHFIEGSCYGNLGDVVQSWAGSQFLPAVDYFLPRDDLHLSSENPYSIARQIMKNVKRPDSVEIIMNSWLFERLPYSAVQWPPSAFIQPTLVSMHFYDKRLEDFRSPESLEYFHRQSFLGTRDFSSLKFLKSLKFNHSNKPEIKFTGCATSTIRKLHRPGAQRLQQTGGGEILIIDPYWPDRMSQYLPPKILKKAHYWSNLVNLSSLHHLDNLQPPCGSAAALALEYQLVEQLLNRISSADLIITSRLHIAIPAISLGIPILFLYPEALYQWEIHHGRFGGLLDHLLPYIYHEKDSYFYRNSSHRKRVDWKFPKRQSIMRKENILYLNRLRKGVSHAITGRKVIFREAARLFR